MENTPLFFDSSISAGFLTSAQEGFEAPLDLNNLMVKKPAATFFVRVSGDSMIGAGIFPKDILVVDRSIENFIDKVIVARIDQEFTVKRIVKDNQKIKLVAENPKYKDILITEDMDFEVWGVVTFCIHAL